MKMLIISKFKDYYDHISYLYGVDEKVIFKRADRKLTKEQHRRIEKMEFTIPDAERHNRYVGKKNIYQSNYKEYDYEIYYVSICGRLHLIVRNVTDKNSKFHLITESDYTWMGWKQRKYKWDNDRDPSFDDCIGNHLPKDYLIELHKMLNVPVFMFYNHRTLLDSDYWTVNLGELGIGRLYTPEQIYQEISQFISNVMVENADILPPVEISDKDKIVGHGFDIKQSFRNRKNDK